MRFPRRNRDTLEINLTPLIDVVFLLLIFFMVSTTFSKETQLVIDLPESSIEETSLEEEVVDISISKRGSIAVNQRLILDADLDSLIAAITKVSGTKNTVPIVISADAETPHQSVVMAMDAAGRLGFTKIKISTKHVQP
ncbi:MAG: biopolymer transporter ExbD [Gammaproteobacteria bacterium TMED1]|nr:MAG: biopolymer transporter ExbD [Gammaproteobacteria bacterium TMED1]